MPTSPHDPPDLLPTSELYYFEQFQFLDLCSDKVFLNYLSFIESVSSNILFFSLYSWTDGPPWPLIVLRIIIIIFKKRNSN